MSASEKSALLPRSGERSAAVRKRLIDVAERLFAEHGIEAVSLNQIARAANQRNATVIQYHLGSKLGLIRAIAERRMEAVNERRLELLRRVSGADRVADLRAAVEAMVIPFAEHLSHEGGSYFVRFVAQLYSAPGLELFNVIKGRHDSGMREAGRVVRAVLAELPVPVVKHRLAIVTGMIFANFADRERLRAAAMHVGAASLHNEHFVSDLIAMIVGALNAPYTKRAEAKDSDAATDADAASRVIARDRAS